MSITEFNSCYNETPTVERNNTYKWNKNSETSDKTINVLNFMWVSLLPILIGAPFYTLYHSQRLTPSLAPLTVFHIIRLVY